LRVLRTDSTAITLEGDINPVIFFLRNAASQFIPTQQQLRKNSTAGFLFGSPSNALLLKHSLPRTFANLFVFKTARPRIAEKKSGGLSPSSPNAMEGYGQFSRRPGADRAAVMPVAIARFNLPSPVVPFVAPLHHFAVVCSDSDNPAIIVVVKSTADETAKQESC
jgi:hypothetical protein